LEAYRFLGDGKNVASPKQIRAALSFAYKHWDLKNGEISRNGNLCTLVAEILAESKYKNGLQTCVNFRFLRFPGRRRKEFLRCLRTNGVFVQL
jgi:hypothetical protein